MLKRLSFSRFFRAVKSIFSRLLYVPQKLRLYRRLTAAFLAFVMSFSPVFPFLDEFFFVIKDVENLASYAASQIKTTLVSDTNTSRDPLVFPDFATPDKLAELKSSLQNMFTKHEQRFFGGSPEVTKSLFGASKAQAGVTKTWTGSGNCSTAENWSGGTIPAVDDDIVLDATSIDNLTWDSGCPNTVNSWTQSADYTGTVTISTVYSEAGFHTFTITNDLIINGGTWTHIGNTTAQMNRLKLAVGGNFTLGASGVINVDNRGYSPKSGPGAPTSGSQQGGAHGGLGAVNHTGEPSGSTYGLITMPVSLGSGGDNRSGGGAVYMAVTGNSIVSGVLTANGQGGGGGAYGAGAGGSVYIETATISGNGIIRAAGSNATHVNTRGGGGGRVAIILTQGGADFDSFGGVIHAYGATDSSSPGAAGTVYRQTGDQGSGDGELIIDNNNIVTRAGAVTAIPSSETWGQSIFKTLTLQNRGILSVGSDETLDLTGINITTDTNIAAGIRLNGGTLTVPGGALTVQNWSLIVDGVNSLVGNITVANGGNITHSDVRTMDLTLAGNLTIESGGMVNVDGKGHSQLTGPGSGDTRSGGGHGGMGGQGNGGSPGITYGSITAPATSGSGGPQAGATGGGAAKMVINGDLTVNGTVSAGAPTTSFGAGAGGSIYLTSNTISGNGTIRANGGNNPGHPWGGAGGGGRVALKLTSTGADFSNFSGIITAYGGVASDATRHGAAGTVYKQTEVQGTGGGDLIINNNSQAVTPVTDLDGASDRTETVGNLFIQSSARFRIGADDTLNITGSSTTLTVNTGTIFTNQGTLNLGGTTFTNSGTVNFATDGNTVKYTGQANDAVVTTLPATYHHLAFDNVGTTFSLGGATDVSGDFTLTNGTVDLSGRDLSVSGSVSNSGTVMLDGSETVTWTNDTDSGTVLYKGADNQTGLAAGDAYHHLAIGSVGDHTTEDGLVGYWKFDEGTGTVANDSSGNDNHGTLVNGPTWTTDTADVSFSNPYALEFDGVDDYVEVAADASLNVGNSLTASAWIYRSTTSRQTVYSHGSDGGGGFQFEINGIGGGGSFGTIIPGSFIAYTDGGLLSQNEWYHIAYTRTGTGSDTHALYLNGVEQSLIRNSAHNYTDKTADTLIGARSLDSQNWNGSLDDVRIYNRALSAEEISHLATGKHSHGGYGGATYTLSSNLDISGDLTLDYGTLDVSADNHDISLAGSWINNEAGTYNSRSGTVNLTGTQAGQTIKSGTDSFSSLTVSGSGEWTLQDELTVSNNFTMTDGTLDVSENNYAVNVGGNWTNSGGTFNARQGTVTLNASAGAPTFNETGSFYDLAFNDSGGSATYTLASALNIDNNLTIDSGTLDVSESNYDVNVAGSWINNAGAFTARQGTVTLTSAGSSAVKSNSQPFYNLIQNGVGGTYTLQDTLTILNNLTITNGTLDVSASNYGITIGNNYSNDGTLTPRNGTVTFNKASGTQTLNSGGTGAGKDFHNLAHSGAGILRLTANPLVIGGNLANSAGIFDLNSQNLTVTGSVSNSGTVMLDGSETVTWTNDTDSGTVLYKGADNQTGLAAGDAYHHLAIGSVGDHTTEDGLVGYWKFDEGTGTVANDSSGSGNHGTLVNGPTWTTDTADVSFSNPYALEFDGSNYVSLGSDLFEEYNQGTISAWINKVDIGRSVIYGHAQSTSATNYLRFGLHTDQYLDFEIPIGSPNASVHVRGNTVLNDGEWYHVVITSDGTKYAMYVNGQEEPLTFLTGSNTGRWFANMFEPREHFDRIGRIFGVSVATIRYEGHLDDIRIYNRALSAEEVANLADGIHANGGGSTFTLSSNLDISGNLTLDYGTLDVSADNRDISLAGSWTNNEAGSFNPRLGTVNLTGTETGQTIQSGTDNFASLTVSGSGEWTLQDELTVNNNFTMTDGTLDVSENNYAVNVGGGWTTVGDSVFGRRQGTVTLNGAVNQTLDANNKPFYNLDINNTGGAGNNIVSLASGMTVDNDLNIISGILSANAQAIAIGGNWNNQAGNDAFVAGTGTVELTNSQAGSNQQVLGDTTFNNLVKNVTNAATLTFEAAKTFVVNGLLQLKGALDNLLSVASSILGTRYNLDPPGEVDLQYLDIQDADNISGTDINTFQSVDSGNNENILFDTFLWTGEGGDNNCSTPANWDYGAVPDVNSHILLNDASAANLVWDAGCPDNIASLTLDTGYAGTATVNSSLTVAGPVAVNGGILTVDGTLATAGSSTTLTVGSGAALTVNGTLSLAGAPDPISLSGTWTINNGSTVMLTGQADNTTVNIPDVAYHSLSLNKDGTVFELVDTLTVNGNLTIAAGVLNQAGEDLSLNEESVFSNQGVLRLFGSETLTNFTNDTDSGTVEYLFSATGLNAGSDYYNLSFNGAEQVWAADENLIVNNNLTLTNGTLDMAGFDLAVAGDVSRDVGVLTNTDSSTITLFGAAQLFEPGEITMNTLALAAGTGAVTLGSAVTVSDGLSVGAGRTLDLGASVLHSQGNLLNEGLIVTSGGSIKHPSSDFKLTDAAFAEQSVFSIATADPIYATLTDANRNLDGTVKDTLQITLTCPGDSETMTLTETGSATGIFRSLQAVTLGAGANPEADNGVLECTDGDTVTAEYTDNQDETDTAAAAALATGDALPAAPAGAVAVQITRTTAEYGWTGDGLENGFRIYDADTDQQIAEILAGAASYTETGLTRGTSYSRYATAFSTAGESAPSNTISFSTRFFPDAPSHLQGTAVSSTEITYTWQDNSDNETGFKLLDGNNNEVATIASNTFSYTETGLTRGTTYTRKVVAYNEDGHSAASNIVSVTTRASAPTTVSLMSPADGAAVNTNTPTFTFGRAIDEDDGLQEYVLKVGSAEFVVPADEEAISHPLTKAHHTPAYSVRYLPGQITVTPRRALPEGRRFWTVTARDTAGNISVSAERAVVIDTAAPTISHIMVRPPVIYPGMPAGFSTASPRPTATALLTDNHLLKQLVITLERQTGILGGYTALESRTIPLGSERATTAYTPGEEMEAGGVYRLTLELTDAAGNVTSANRTIRVLTAEGLVAIKEQYPDAEDIVLPPVEDLPDSVLVDEEQLPAGEALLKRSLRLAELRALSSGPLEKLYAWALVSSSRMQRALLAVFDWSGDMYDRIAGALGGAGRYLADVVFTRWPRLADDRGRAFVNLLVMGRETRARIGEDNRRALAAASGQLWRPVQQATGIAWLKTRATYELWFSRTPTRIANVAVTALSDRSAVIEWETNHLTRTAKVNWGADPSLPWTGEAFAPDGLSRQHLIEITDLDPDTTYYFEIMNRNGDYVFDAYYALTTLPEQAESLPEPLRPQSAVLVERAAIYRRPDLSAEVLAEGSAGDSFRTLTAREGWVSILLPSQAIGWIREEFIELRPQAGETGERRDVF